MSRTFRKRKNNGSPFCSEWYRWDWERVGRCRMVKVYLDPKSKEFLKRKALYHSDAGTHKCKEPGPSWYRRITRQVPLRRHGKEELRKFMLNEGHEVMITENPPLEWWT